MLDLQERDFIRLVNFMKNKYGIELGAKKQLIQSRLALHVQTSGYGSFENYIGHVLNKNPADEIEKIVNTLTTNYTYFMREHSHFDYVAKQILPALEQSEKGKRSVSVWSAGCSSGQEPYTLSMILLDHFRNKSPKWDTRVLATDISERALCEARAATYSENMIADLPSIWRERYVKKSERNGFYTFTDEVRNNVVFRYTNLMESFKFKTDFDIIFCRNVMIYFDKTTKDALAKRFYNVTKPGGHFFVGHTESITDSGSGYTYVMPAGYRK